MKVVKKRYPEISLNELVNIFEQGITGDFGKVYSPEELRSMDLNQATSIVDAMKLMGDDSSFAISCISFPQYLL